MNTSKQDPNKNDVMDGVDDLTRFLDEDFDTDDVDLFEFTSEEESPLTQLKSIILSLEWEINDETLHDLIDEIENLRQQDLFAGDKVSQVYLQGLDKIGHYLQSEGAYAHPNSIKLLLTLYYDFEKILSSEHITGAEITALLKADVRKFKILQHQIAQKHGVGATASEGVGTPLPLSEHKDLVGVQAAILELDWEVTDEGLKNLSDQLTTLKEQYQNDKSVTVIIQGLFSLNAYLMEEKSRAHPETFSLIHNFYDALETLIENDDLDDEARKEILIDRVNRLNNLKNLIAQTYTTEDLAPEAINPVAEAEEEELSLDVDVGAETQDLEIDVPVEEEAPAAPAEEMLMPVGEDDDDEYDEPLVAEGEELPPALADSSETAGFGSSEDLEAPPEELEEKLDFFFGSDKVEFEPEAIEEAVASKAAQEPEEEPEEEPFEDEVAPALAGSVEETGFTGAGEDLEEPPEELAEKLDSFFGATDEEAPVAEAPAAEEEPAVAFEAEESLDESGPAPALADSDEDTGFTGEGEDLEGPPEELTEKLDSFFGESAEEPVAAVTETPSEPEEEEPAVTFEAEEEPAVALESEEDTTPDEESEVAPALADTDEVAGFGALDDEAAAPPEELAEKLDSFFGETEKAEPQAEEADEEVLLTPALEETEPVAEEEIAVETEPASLSTPEEFQSALEQMRNSYRELQESMRSEIDTLRREIEELRNQLNK